MGHSQRTRKKNRQPKKECKLDGCIGSHRRIQERSMGDKFRQCPRSRAARPQDAGHGCRARGLLRPCENEIALYRLFDRPFVITAGRWLQQFVFECQTPLALGLRRKGCETRNSQPGIAPSKGAQRACCCTCLLLPPSLGHLVLQSVSQVAWLKIRMTF
jgi:hypothetical protein